MNFLDRAKLAARALFGGTPLSTGNIVYMGGDSYSGVTVTEDRAMTFAPVFACVRIISEDIGALPVHLYKRTDNGREIARDHPVDRLMREPNPMMTASVFRETMMGHVLLWGNFYAEIEFNANMEPVALWPLNPSNTKPMKTKDGDLYYQTYLPDGKMKDLYDWQVWHLMGYSTDGLSGRSAIEMMRETVGLGMAAQEFGGRYFGSGANMGGFFETPGTLSEPAYNRLKTEINEQMSGLSKAHRAVILEEGAKFARNTIPANEAQMLETRKFQIEDVARFFRVPLHLVGDLSKSTNNNIEHQSIDYLVHCLLPWLVKIEQVNDRKLLIGATERAEYFCKHNMDGLLRGDTQTRYAAYAVGRQWGWLSANDVREKEDMNRIEGGDTYLVPMNMIPADRLGDPPDDEDFEQGATRRAEVRSAASDDAIRYAQARLDVIHAAEVAIKDALEGIINLHCDTLSGYVPLIEQGAPDKFMTSAADYLLDRAQYQRLSSALSSSIPQFAVQTRQILQAELGNVLDDIEYKKIIDGFISSAAKDYPARSLEQLRQILSSKKSVDEIAEKIRARLLDWHNNRALQLGENSAVKLTNEMTRKAAKKKGYRVIWQVMSGSPCQFCATLNGVTVDAGDTFKSTKKGHKNRLNPPLHNGCHCMLVVETK
ncbi:MAG: phage portal protein [Clostridiaceae bacterium]|nr:phage portal protein [Clostridiaceae bacterium]